jgi:hypothetical protein
VTFAVTSQHPPLRLAVLGSFGTRQEHLALPLLTAAACAGLIAPIIAVTCPGDRERRITLVRMSLEQARAPYIPVLEAAGCHGHPELTYAGSLERDGISAGSLADQRLEDVAAVVLGSGAPLVHRHRMQHIAVAELRPGAPGSCPPSHLESESRRTLTQKPRVTDASDMAVLGAQFTALEDFQVLHAPACWGLDEKRGPVPVPFAPRSVRQRAAAGKTPRGIAEIGAVLAGLVYAVRSAEGRDRRKDTEVATELVATLAA